MNDKAEKLLEGKGPFESDYLLGILKGTPKSSKEITSERVSKKYLREEK